MVAFSIAGFVLSSRPDLLHQLQDSIANQLPGDLSKTISSALTSAVNARTTVGVIGLIGALYSGIGWVGNLRAAVQAQWREDFDTDSETVQENFLLGLIRNLLRLVGLGLAIAVSLGLSAAGNALQPVVVNALGLGSVSWLQPVFVVVPILIAVAADTLIFGWLYSSLSPVHTPLPRRALLLGSVFAAVAFEVLKQLLTALPRLYNQSATAQVFGNIIGLLFFFNLTATLVLRVAAWIATATRPDRRSWVEQAADADDGLPVASSRRPPTPSYRPAAVAGLVGLGAALGWAAGRWRRPRDGDEA